MIRVRITVRERFGPLSRAQAEAVNRVRKQTGFDVERDWKSDVRVDTGTYRRSIHTDDDGERRTTVSSNIVYALPNEYGNSRGMAPRPSATQAAERARHAFPAAAKRAIASVP